MQPTRTVFPDRRRPAGAVPAPRRGVARVRRAPLWLPSRVPVPRPRAATARTGSGDDSSTAERAPAAAAVPTALAGPPVPPLPNWGQAPGEPFQDRGEM